MSMNPDFVIISKNGYDFIVNAKNNRYLYFWNHIDNWEIDTFRVFDRYLNNQFSYLDIGAWIGPTVLYAAYKAKHVYGLEPDPVAFQELITNIRLNPAVYSRITCIPAALTAKSGSTKLFMRTEFGDSSSSTLPTLSEHFIEANTISIDELITDYRIDDINFLKIDIEGGEYALIPAIHKFLKRYRPTLNLSMHPQFLQENNLLLSSEHNAPDTSNLTVLLTERLIECLSFYKYIYGPEGKRVSKDAIYELTDYGMFTFTDEPW
jgi:FkbM family methyltransferase